MMTDQSGLLVLLKYDILTADPSAWHLCETYPKEVQVKWAWRCAADCEHLAKGYPEAEKCIEVAKKFRDGLATIGELEDTPATHSIALDAAYYAAHAAYYAAKATDTTRAVYHAVHAVARAGSSESRAEKWDLYLSWLIEELCAWEEKRALTSREAMVDQ